MDCASAICLADAIQQWMLARAQIHSGRERGGVAGLIRADGRPEFLYPEAAGYYLTWLAFLLECGHSRAVLASRARLAASHPRAVEALDAALGTAARQAGARPYLRRTPRRATK